MGYALFIYKDATKAYIIVNGSWLNATTAQYRMFLKEGVYMIFADKLLLLRKQKGLSQEQLAELLEVSRQSISKWESQQALPETNKVIALSNVFDVSIDQLLKDDLEIEGLKEIETIEVEAPSIIPLEVMFCTKCGKENAADSKFCGYCGNPFTSFVAEKENDGKLTKEDMDLAYYKASLQMQQQELLMKEQELAELQRHTEQQQQQLQLQQEQYSSMMKCPRCGSTSLSGNKKGYGIGKGVVGAAVFGPLGLVAGNIGSKKVLITCMKCGHRFKK